MSVDFIQLLIFDDTGSLVRFRFICRLNVKISNALCGSPVFVAFISAIKCVECLKPKQARKPAQLQQTLKYIKTRSGKAKKRGKTIDLFVFLSICLVTKLFDLHAMNVYTFTIIIL